MTRKTKRNLLWTALLLSLSSTQLLAQQQLKINAELPGLKDGEKVYLIDYVKQQMDSTLVENHKFQFVANTDSSSLYVVQVGLQPKEGQYFYMDMGAGELKIAGKGDSFKDAAFTGSSFVAKWRELDEFLVQQCGAGINYASELAQKMGQAQAVGDAQALEDLQKQYLAYVEKSKVAAKAWIAKNPDEPISAYVINGFLFNKIPLEEVQTLLKGLGPKAQKSKLAAAMLRAQAPKMTSPLVNQQAPDFTLTDAEGKQVKLSDFKGKYVLLDFWASWCAPCRREMPYLKAAYEKYNSPNFTILSVSIDTETDKWRKALNDEKMPWTQLLEDSKQQASTLYSVQFIPTNFLIDPAGKVIAYGLYGEEVSKQLGSTLKN